jgi:hypothetical protein
MDVLQYVPSTCPDKGIRILLSTGWHEDCNPLLPLLRTGRRKRKLWKGSPNKTYTRSLLIKVR